MNLNLSVPKSIDPTLRVFFWHFAVIILPFILAAFALMLWTPDFFSAGAPSVYVFGAALGLIHTWILFTKHSWTSRDNYLWESLLTIGVALLAELYFLVGIVVSGLSLRYFDTLQFNLAVSFLLPYVALRVIDLLQANVRAVYRIYFPGSQPPVVVFDESGSGGFIFYPKADSRSGIKLPGEVGVSVQQLPKEIMLGGFFHAAMIYHRRRNSEAFPPGLFAADQDTVAPVGWLFYQPKWGLFRQYLDPEDLLESLVFKTQTVIRSDGSTARLKVAKIYVKAVH